jgi:hypothetical protein
MSDPALELLWKHVLGQWDDTASHRAFLEHCREHKQLVEAAVRYRGMKGDHARGPKAEQQLTAIAALALAQLESSRTPDRRKHGRFIGYLLVAFFLSATLGLLAYLGRTH